MNVFRAETSPVSAPSDEAVLHRFGYAQVLYRGMGEFSNFAISFCAANDYSPAGHRRQPRESVFYRPASRRQPGQPNAQHQQHRRRHTDLDRQ